MSIFAKKGKNYTPPPEGLWPAVCVDVEDLGVQHTIYGEKDDVRLTFQINLRTQEGKRYEVKRPLTNTLHEKSNLRKYVEALEGRSLSP